jgi:threonine synthase
MSVWRWADAIAAVPPEERITLGEAATPFLPARRIGRSAGIEHLYLKVETANPTGSYKDRFAAVAVSHMRASGQRTAVATSSGNTGAALAAYCAAAGLRCEIAAVEDAPSGKLRQMRAYGAHVVRVRGFGLDPVVTRDVFAAVGARAAAPGAALQISAYSASPIGMSGVETIAWELVEQADVLGLPVARVFCPAGGGGLALAVTRGFAAAVARGRLPRMPRIEIVQPVGNATIAGPLREGVAQARTVSCTTAIGGLQVPTVLDGDELIRAARPTGGSGHLVRDEAIYDAQARVAHEEGIYAEPAGAAALAGALSSAREGDPGDSNGLVVCLVTGSGFKDPDSVDRMLDPAECPVLDVRDLAR